MRMVNVWCIAYMRSTPCTWYTPSRSVAIHGHLSCVLLQLVEHVEQQLVRAATNGLFDQLFEDEDATLIHNDAAAYRGGFRKGLYEGRGELSDERET